MKSTKINPWIYFLIVFGWSWLFGFLAVFLGLNASHPAAAVLRILHGLGPTIAAAVLLIRYADSQERREFAHRIYSLKRISPKWLSVTLLLLPVLLGITHLLEIFSGGAGVRLAADFRSNLFSILPLAGFTLFFGPLPEEIGWRGIALDGLQRRYSPFISSTILGSLWAIWHFPLFFIEGTYQNSLAFGSPQSWMYLTAIVFNSLLITWIYDHTDRSVLSAILFHFMTNFLGELFILSPSGESTYYVLQAGFALSIYLFKTEIGFKKLQIPTQSR